MKLAAIPHLRIRVRAGAAGGDREVTWAHSSDLPNAIDWLAPGELLMSNGSSLPPVAAAQIAVVDQLAAAGLSGVAIGDEPRAPPVARACLQRAEELSFPVLEIPYDVPFAAVSRAVANANTNEEQSRLVRTVQLYDLLRNAVADGAVAPDLIGRMARQLECRLRVLDVRTGLPAVADRDELPAQLAAGVVDQLRARGGFPGILRLAVDGDRAVAIKVPAARPTALVAVLGSERGPDLALLQHAATIAALEVGRIAAERAAQRRLARNLLTGLLKRRVDPASAQGLLAEHGLELHDDVVAVFDVGAEFDEEDVHHALAHRGIAHVLLVDEAGLGLAVLPGTAAALEALGEAAHGARVGVSDFLGRADRVPDAAREAQWAHTAARTLPERLVRYGLATPLFLPRTLGEAELAAARVLGALLAYDAEHGTELLHSLGAFLANNRSWQRTASVLHVHKQTLVSRIRRIEVLTGRRLNETADVAELWLALQAHDVAHGGLSAGARRS